MGWCCFFVFYVCLFGFVFVVFLGGRGVIIVQMAIDVDYGAQFIRRLCQTCE